MSWRSVSDGARMGKISYERAPTGRAGDVVGIGQRRGPDGEDLVRAVANGQVGPGAEGVRVRRGGGVGAHRPILPLRGGSRPMPVQGRPGDRSPATGGPMGAGTPVDRAIRNRFVTADAHARTPGSAQSTDARTG